MASYNAANTKFKIIVGEVTSSQDQSIVGSVASQSAHFINSLDSTNNKIISITTQLNGKNSTVTIVGGA